MQILDMLQIDKSKCTGCQSCACICPCSAIKMVPDSEGFLYPQIDKELCTNCNLCVKTCPILRKISTSYTSLLNCFAYINTNEKERMSSSSGGFFSKLANNVLAMNGIVYGAAYDENWNVRHICGDKKEDLALLRGSKYVQSDINKIYVDVKKHLQKNINVLFIGTPCQTEGLRSYLKKYYENLLIVDFICHGVPSPIVWKEYLRIKSKTNEIVGINMRDKSISWKRFSIEFKYKNGNCYKTPLDRDLYIQGFLKNLYLRPSCYHCSNKHKDRCSDITIADFWGIDAVVPEMNDHKGTSLVIIHTTKGQKYFEKIEGKKKKVEFHKAVLSDSAMINSAAPNRHRSDFFHFFTKNPKQLEFIINKYTKISFDKRLYFFIRKIFNIINRFILAVKSCKYTK